jgi:hypothetical protein
MVMQVSFQIPMYPMHKLCLDWWGSSVLLQVSRNAPYAELSHHALCWLRVWISFRTVLLVGSMRWWLDRVKNFHNARVRHCSRWFSVPFIFCQIWRHVPGPMASHSYIDAVLTRRRICFVWWSRNVCHRYNWSPAVGHVQRASHLPCDFSENSTLQQ